MTTYNKNKIDERLDLNLNNYDIEDIISLFKLKANFTFMDLNKAKSTVIQLNPSVNNNVTTVEQYEFFFTAYEILEKYFNKRNFNKHSKKDLNLKYIDESDFSVNVNETDEHLDINNKMIRSKNKTHGDVDYDPQIETYNNTNLIPSRKIEINKTTEIKYAPGILNPIYKNYITKTICIDSLFRQDYDNNPSSMLYKFPVPLKNVMSMRLVSTEIPFSWYAFSSKKKSNTFTIALYNIVSTDENGALEKDEDDKYIFTDIVHEIEIPSGNYLSEDLIMTINNIFLNTKQGLDYLIFDINEQNGKCIFRSRNNQDLPQDAPLPFDKDGPYFSENFYFELYFNIEEEEPYRPLYLNAGWMLGFNKDMYLVNESNQFISYSKSNVLKEATFYDRYLQSEASYDRPSTLQYIFVDVDDFNNNFNTDTIISKIPNSYLGKNILARVAIDNGPNTIITTDNSSLIKRQRDYFGPVSIDKVFIKLIDKFGEVIDLNYSDYSIVLEFDLTI